MAKIIGIIVVFASVLGGYVLSHGKIGALIQPFEVMIIGGAAFGAFLQANPGYMTMHVVKKSLGMFGSRFTHTRSIWKCWGWSTRSSTRAAAKA